jgi:mannosyltransferase
LDSVLNKIGGPGRAAWLIFALGALIRLYNFTGMGMWIDEGYSILFMHQSWPAVLGLHGAYDSHPPLYWATAKLFSLVLPDLAAGRMVSVVCGTLTLPVLFLLARRLAGTHVALAATLALAVAPLHVWYSQEARMYVPSMLFVTLSYLALVEFYYEPKRKWAVWYAFAVLMAMYFSYSSVYALVPQVVLFLLLLRKQKGASTPLFVGLGVAIVLYLPWIPQWLTSIQDADPFRVTYLGVDPGKILFQTMEVSGLAERGFVLSRSLLPWESANFLYYVFGAGALLAGLAGIIALFLRSKLGLVAALTLWLGTGATAIILSIISPGFASRTTLYAMAGWVIIAGAATLRGKLPVWASALGRAGYAVVIFFSLVSLQQIYATAFKQDWQSMANDVTAVANRSDNVLFVRDVDETIIDYYHPGALASVAITDTEQLTGNIVWFPYHDSPRFQVYHDRLAQLGYVRVMHKYYFNPLYLDLYVKPGTHIGVLSPENPALSFASADSTWKVTPGGPDDRGSAISPDSATLGAGAQAVSVLPAVPYRAYSLETTGAGNTDGAAPVAGLQCLTDAYTSLLESVSTVVAAPGPPSTAVAIVCPPDTSKLAITLANKGQGSARFGPVALYETTGH